MATLPQAKWRDILAVDFIAGMVFKLWREFPSSLRAFLERSYPS
jgi:hypothetical protein